LAAGRKGGLIMLPPPPSRGNRDSINRLALKHRLPTMWQSRYLPAEGGMMGYGPDSLDLSVAASYVDRILRGAKISDLPVQFPTKFELVINLNAAKAIGRDIPATLVLRADELIQ